MEKGAMAGVYVQYPPLMVSLSLSSAAGSSGLSASCLDK